MGGGGGGGGGGLFTFILHVVETRIGCCGCCCLTARELGIKQCSQKKKRKRKKRRENQPTKQTNKQTNKKARKKAVRCGRSREVPRAVGRIGHAT